MTRCVVLSPCRCFLLQHGMARPSLVCSCSVASAYPELKKEEYAYAATLYIQSRRPPALPLFSLPRHRSAGDRHRRGRKRRKGEGSTPSRVGSAHLPATIWSRFGAATSSLRFHSSNGLVTSSQILELVRLRLVCARKLDLAPGGWPVADSGGGFMCTGRVCGVV